MARTSPPLLIVSTLAWLAVACTESKAIAPPAFPPGDSANPQPVFEPYVPPAGMATGGAAAAPGPLPDGATGGTGGTGGVAMPAPGACTSHPAMPPMFPSLPLVLGPTVSAARPPRAISGGTLTVSGDGRFAVAADPDRDRVYVVDAAKRALLFTVALEPGDEPGRVVEGAGGRFHVVLRGSGAVVSLDPATGALGPRRAVCSTPRGLAYQPSADLLHVACADGRLRALAAGSGAVVRSLALAPDLRDVVLAANDQLIVSTFRGAEAIVVSAEGEVLRRQRPPARHRPSFLGPQTLSASVAWRLAPTPSGGAVMLHQRGVDEEIDPVAGAYGGGKGCDGVVESVVTEIVPTAVRMNVSPALAQLSLAVDVAISPDGGQAAIAVAGNAHTTAPSVVVEDLTDTTTATTDCRWPRRTVEAGGEVVAVAYAPDGVLLAQTREPAGLAFQMGGGDVSIVSLSSVSVADTGHALFHANVGAGIACASCHPEGGEDGRVWRFSCVGARRTQSMRGKLSDTAPFHWGGEMDTFSKLVDEGMRRMSGPPLEDDTKNALIGWLDTLPQLPPLIATPTAASTRGKVLFDDPTVACASCHAGERLTDNRTLDVGTGLELQVPSLRGVAWRAPFLHDGCAATLRDRFGACGGGDEHGHTSGLAPEQLDDLVAYLQTL